MGSTEDSVAGCAKNSPPIVKSAARHYAIFLPEASFPVIRASVNGETAGALFFLFFSAFGFFFSRLLLIWPFATLSSLCLRNT
jgi:hypothetical protein